MIEFEVATSAAIKKLAGNMVVSAKGPINEKISALRDEKYIKKYVQYAENLNKVKTIYDPEKFSKLSYIYLPLEVSISDSTFIPRNVDCLFGGQSAVLIEGTAGQGKSFFMRYMCFNEMKRGVYLPFLILLRNYKTDDTIIDLMFREYKSCGFNGDKKTLIHFLVHGKVVLFFDGYDEVHPDLKDKMAIELEELIKRYNKSNYIISSRPELSLGLSYFLTIVKLESLGAEEQKAIIKKNISNEVKRDILFDAIENREYISEVVNTPLLLMLLLVAYKSESRVPETLVEFYRLILPTMLYRHDDTKLGYQRKRLSNLGRYEFQEVFDSFSFISLKKSKAKFSGHEYNKYVLEAMKALSGDYDLSEIDKVTNDITKVTCLVVEDGYDQFIYIHKTIQEFHAACFINGLGALQLEKFYKKLLSDFEFYNEWHQVSLFLKSLNPRFFIKCLMIPAYSMFFTNRNKVSKKGLNLIIGEGAHFTAGKSEKLGKFIFQEGYFSLVSISLKEILHIAIEKYFQNHKEEIWEQIELLGDEVHRFSRSNDMGLTINTLQFLKSVGKLGKCLDYINSQIGDEIKLAKVELESKVSKFKNVDSLLDF